MKYKNQNKKTNSDFQKFIDYREELSLYDKKIEAAKIIHQIDKVEVGSAYDKVVNRINHTLPRHQVITLITRFAAILTLPLLVFTIWSLFFQKTDELHLEVAQNNITWQEIFSPIGMRSQVLLPDGSKLWLNAGSQLRYSIPFIRENRTVELSGEAFIDVNKHENSPFIVKAGITEVEVLGTEFNVNAWPHLDNIEVALKEGNVKFRFKAEDGVIRFTELKENDFLEFNKTAKSIQLENTNIEKYIAWHQNVMILDDTSMIELANLLEQWYGVKVVIANEEIKRYRFTTTFVNEPLHRVLELLEISSPGIKINYTPGKPIDGTKEFSPSVVTILKN